MSQFSEDYSAAPPYMSITYRADLAILVVRWLEKISLTQLQAGYQAILGAAEHYQCHRWLLDARRRVNTDREGAAWMVKEFLPQLGPRLGGRTCLAYLLAPAIFRDPTADAAFPPPTFFDGKPFLGERFINESDAVAWLQAQPA